MQKYDLTVHFTLKGQQVSEIDRKLTDWLKSENYQGQFDFSERLDDEPRNVLHHCFLPKRIIEEKGFSTEVWDFLEMVSDDIICWYGVSGNLGLVWDRRYMLENLKKINGTAIFIGNIIDGVKEEYDIAQELGIDCILIP